MPELETVLYIKTELNFLNSQDCKEKFYPWIKLVGLLHF